MAAMLSSSGSTDHPALMHSDAVADQLAAERSMKEVYERRKQQQEEAEAKKRQDAVSV